MLTHMGGITGPPTSTTVGEGGGDANPWEGSPALYVNNGG
jgi:hypothetical protein